MVEKENNKHSKLWNSLETQSYSVYLHDDITPAHTDSYIKGEVLRLLFYFIVTFVTTTRLKKYTYVCRKYVTKVPRSV